MRVKSAVQQIAWILVVVYGLQAAHAQIHSSTLPATTSTYPAPAPSTQPSFSSFSSLFTEKSWLGEFLIALLTTIIAPIIVYFITNRQAIKLAHQQLDQYREGITLPQPAANGGRRSSVMIFGIGGSGKTSLIENMFGKGAARTEKTETVWFYEYSDQVKERRADGARSKDSESFTHYISDYKGQNLGTIVQSFILQQKRVFSAMAYGHITAAIFVVDLFETNPNGIPVKCRDRSMPSKDRIKANYTAWNDQALDAIFGMLTSDILRNVILFINKANGFDPRTSVSNDLAVEAYAPLAESIRKRAGQREFTVILGSAGDIGDGQQILHSGGEGTSRMKDLLRKAADEAVGE